MGAIPWSLKPRVESILEGEWDFDPVAGGAFMCLAIPAYVCEISNNDPLSAMVDVLGVRRSVRIDLLSDDPPQCGDWVLIHVGFALSKIDAHQADEQLRLLRDLGEASAALDEAEGLAEDSWPASGGHTR